MQGIDFHIYPNFIPDFRFHGVEAHAEAGLAGRSDLRRLAAEAKRLLAEFPVEASALAAQNSLNQNGGRSRTRSRIEEHVLLVGVGMCETMEDAEHQTGNSSGRPIMLGGSTATSKTGSDAQLLFALESLCGHVSV